MTFAIGTGKTLAFGPPRYLNSGWSSAAAAALAFGSDTARMAFAPSLDLVSVPSSSSMVRSTAQLIERIQTFATQAGSFSVTFLTASARLCRENAFCRRRGVQWLHVRRCWRRWGRPARPAAPDSRVTSTSTVGLPRESRISRASIFWIFVIYNKSKGTA